MVAKHVTPKGQKYFSLNLAKIHMVAKLICNAVATPRGLNLAKIHMVAKLKMISEKRKLSLNLAKIHMVAKRTSICILVH